ncbi:hypothetical protein LTR91_019149 [Friedmanniomyces endolithicus]|uniref:Uncharacterized protein n=1 Tax=Friedmanniomyces endolithicus TaxID=329885 RepID=A0AAN6K1M7_9PEZI|nr:hypothetical protein LTR38_005429 [Friedmanniomyces endolithicus]KAK0813438.1 hypothetical protein LTR59_001224 [Friedmanniomyces endolithicus]KAK0821422.1 hypothetical protein LTR75_000897 [Friedmanniomyces endolithicus]KAK0833362.1 hypothetical protein LTR03_014850 [Friedmanniomyces endolithicus]KAK0851906.1 hypothetical protein LTS02_012564 [Friedmanniomyces endolithicus]
MSDLAGPKRRLSDKASANVDHKRLMTAKDIEDMMAETDFPRFQDQYTSQDAHDERPSQDQSPSYNDVDRDMDYGIGLFRHSKPYLSCQPQEQQKRRHRITQILSCSNVQSPYELIPPGRRHGFPVDPRNASSKLMEGIMNLSYRFGKHVQKVRHLVDFAVSTRIVQPKVALCQWDLEEAMRIVVRNPQMWG